MHHCLCGGGILILRQRNLSKQCLLRFPCLNVKIFTVCAVERFNDCSAQNFGECTIINPTFIVWRKHLVTGQSNFISVFLCFSLVTIKRQTSYDSGILRQYYGIIRDLPIDHRLCGSCTAAMYRTFVLIFKMLQNLYCMVYNINFSDILVWEDWLNTERKSSDRDKQTLCRSRVFVDESRPGTSSTTKISKSTIYKVNKKLKGSKKKRKKEKRRKQAKLKKERISKVLFIMHLFPSC